MRTDATSDAEVVFRGRAEDRRIKEFHLDARLLGRDCFFEHHVLLQNGVMPGNGRYSAKSSGDTGTERRQALSSFEKKAKRLLC